MRLDTLSILLCGVAMFSMTGHASPKEPIRLSNGEPLVGIYFFTHWWEPWKSSDEAILDDLKRLRSMGFNTIFLDHEWSQMIDGNWRLLDRGHRLAKEAGMQILPWLSLKVWGDMGSPGRRRLIKQQYGVTLRTGTGSDGKDNGIVIPYDEATIIAGASYTKQYLDRYAKDGALLHLNWDGKTRPAAALTVELAWSGSCDEATQLMFRLWLKERYGRNIGALNKAWGTTFGDFNKIDMCDASIFDLAGHVKGAAKHPKAVEDHVEFRAQVINASLAAVRERVKKDHPDLLVVTELPYQLESEHPHAVGYRVGYGANASSAEHADILVIRATGPLSRAEQKAHLSFKERVGIKTIMAYRTYWQWGRDSLDGKLTPREMEVYPTQAAALAKGFGFYSFNEMVDTHLAADPTPPHNPANRAISKEESRAALSSVAEMVKKYLEILGNR